MENLATEKSDVVAQPTVDMELVRVALLSYINETKQLFVKNKEVVKGGVYDVKYPDPHDAAQVATNFVTADQISSVLKENVRSAEKVLRMIEDGWDGKCEICETEDVPFLRIARYFSPICVTCQQSLERSRK